MTGEQALGSESNLALLQLRITNESVGVICWASVRKLVGHAEVGAQDVDDRLPLVRVVLSETFEGVEPAKTDRGLVRSELLNRLGVQIRHPPGLGVLAGVGREAFGVSVTLLGNPLGVGLGTLSPPGPAPTPGCAAAAPPGTTQTTRHRPPRSTRPPSPPPTSRRPFSPHRPRPSRRSTARAPQAPPRSRPALLPRPPAPSTSATATATPTYRRYVLTPPNPPRRPCPYGLVPTSVSTRSAELHAAGDSTPDSPMPTSASRMAAASLTVAGYGEDGAAAA